MTNFINLTPHAVVICDSHNSVVKTIEPSGQLARVRTIPKIVGEIILDSTIIPVRVNESGPLEGLPEPVVDTVYIVSLQAAVAAARTGRIADILVPDDTVRDEAGRVIGCRAFGRQA